MIPELLRLVGWPVCAQQGCGMPAVVRFEFSDDKGPIWADLCVTCVADAKRCLEEIADVMDERRLPDQREGKP